jgi:hypothetical protein
VSNATFFLESGETTQTAKSELLVLCEINIFSSLYSFKCIVSFFFSVFGSLARRAIVSSTAARLPSTRARFYADAPVNVTLNLTTPHSTVVKEKLASLVTVPGAAGVFGTFRFWVQSQKYSIE